MRDINEYADIYIGRPFENIQIDFRMKKIVEIIENYAHSCILDIGFGPNPFFTYFSDFNKLVAVDPSKSFFDRASEKLNSRSDLTHKVVLINDYIHNVLADLRQYEFDFVIISGLLHEVENEAQLLDNLHNYISPNTIIHINVPNAESFHRLLGYEMGEIESVYELTENNFLLQQHKVFNFSTLSELITAHGFEIIDSGSYFIKPFTHYQMASLMKHHIIDEKVLEGLYNMTKYIPHLGSEIYVNFKST